MPRHRYRTETIIVLVATLAASAVALARDVAVGWELGVGYGLDIWTLAVAVTGFLASAFVTATSGTALPAYRRSLEDANSRFTAVDVVSTSLVLSAGFGLAVGAVMFLAAGPAVDLMLPTSFRRDELVTVLRILAFTVVPGLIMRGTGAALLQAGRRFALAAASAAIPALTVLAAVVAFDVTVRELAVLHGAGALAEFILVTTVVLTVTGCSVRDLGIDRAVLRQLLTGAGPAFVSGIAFSVNPVIDLVVASQLDAGDAGRLGLANRITIAAAALAATSLATPAFPRFVDTLESEGHQALRRLFGAILRRGILVGVVLSLVIAATTFPIADVLFTGGRLTDADANHVAKLQLVYATTAAPYIATTIALRGLHALGRYRAAMAIGLLGTLVNLVADLAIAPTLGVYGIAAATTLVYTLTALSMAMMVVRSDDASNGSSGAASPASTTG
jgi:putative peptidoglycan lipid II flippase